MTKRTGKKRTSRKRTSRNPNNRPASHAATTAHRAAATLRTVARAVRTGDERAARSARERARAEFEYQYGAAASDEEAKNVERAYSWLTKNRKRTSRRNPIFPRPNRRTSRRNGSKWSPAQVQYVVDCAANSLHEEVKFTDATGTKAILYRYKQPVVEFKPTAAQIKKILSDKGKINIRGGQITHRGSWNGSRLVWNRGKTARARKRAR